MRPRGRALPLMDYGPPEMMAVSMARLIRDGETVFFGVSSPLAMVAALLAQRLHAPHSTVIDIAGGINPRPEVLVAATSDPRLAEGSASVFDNPDFYDLVARGGIDLAFLGAAQIDATGHLNTSVIGAHARPKVRFPGGGGGSYIVPLAGRTVVSRAAHSARIFVERCDFVTAAGNLDRVVTPLCVFRMLGGRLEVESVHPYSSSAEVTANTGFALPNADAPSTPPPTDAELAALDDLDPTQVRASEFEHHVR